MTAVAVIPARGGSKRLPRKNLLPLGGRPLVSWTIDAALGCGLFDRIIVSTDDEEIASVARDAGLEVPFLRARHADDHSTASEVTVHALEVLETELSETFDHVAQLLPTCPLRRADHVSKAHDAYHRSGASSQISCTRFGFTNPWWAATLDGDGRPTPVFPDALTRRSQDLPQLWTPTGAIWWASVPALRQSGSFYGDAVRFEPIDWWAAIDVDEHDDLEIARALHAWRTGAGR